MIDDAVLPASHIVGPRGQLVVELATLLHRDLQNGIVGNWAAAVRLGRNLQLPFAEANAAIAMGVGVPVVWKIKF